VGHSLHDTGNAELKAIKYSVCLANQSGTGGRGGGVVVVVAGVVEAWAGGVSGKVNDTHIICRPAQGMPIGRRRCTGCTQGHYMPLLPIPTTAPMCMQQAMASTTCVLQVPRTASTASAAHTLRYPGRDETNKATPSAA
jgi:hypothetical protein